LVRGHVPLIGNDGPAGLVHFQRKYAAHSVSDDESLL
jgi:hypothetical protein